MKTEEVEEFKTNKDGYVDVEYYVDRGHQLRADYMAELKQVLVTWVKSHAHLDELKYAFTRMVHH